LHADIDKLGYFGDVVEVKDGYARNYLLPQGLAVAPTESAIRAIQKEKARKAEQRRLAREQMVKVAQRVDGQTVLIETLANEVGHLFGSVTEAEIAQALQAKGFEVSKKAVRMGEHIRQLGEHEVRLRFAPDIEANVTVQVVSPQTQETPAAKAAPGSEASDVTSESGSAGE
jgi:large subunit ribosomal protein L9